MPHEWRLPLVGEWKGCGNARRRMRGAVGFSSHRFVSVCVLVLVFVPFSVRSGTRGCR